MKFFKCLRKNSKLGLFMYDFRDKRLLLYLHPPNQSNIAGIELFATKLLEVQQHKLNFMLGRFKHDTETKTLASHLARLLHSLPKPANARIHFIKEPYERIVLTFGRELKLFNLEHVASLFKQKGELLLSIAGEILVLTKNDKCSVTIISTRIYEQKLQDAQMAISWIDNRVSGKVSRVLRYVNNFFNSSSKGEKELKRIFAEMGTGECKMFFSALRTSGVKIEQLSHDISESLEGFKKTDKVIFLGTFAGVDMLLYRIQ